MARTAEVIIFLLAVWRASKIITEEEGPGKVFANLRELAGTEFDGVPEQWDLLSWYGKLLQCPYCLSVWIALFLAILYIGNKKLFTVVAMSLSGSGATALIEDYTNG